MVEKKHIKFGVAALAVAALVIGLSIGITERQKNKNAVGSNSVSASLAEYATYDDSCGSESSYSAKSGKSKGSYSGSGSGSAKSGKSGGAPSRRALYVPGTLEAFGDTIKGLDMNQRRKLRNTLANDFDDRRLDSGKSDGSGKSGKSSYDGDGSDGSGKSGKSGSDGSGKSGKSGGHGSSECKSHYGDECETYSSGKSGKSSSYSGSSSKSGKSSSYKSPTTCDDYDTGDVPEPLPPIEELEVTTPPPTPSFEELTDGTYPPTSSGELTDGTYPPTAGGTTTVATEKTGEPTVEGEPRQ